MNSYEDAKDATSAHRKSNKLYTYLGKFPQTGQNGFSSGTHSISPTPGGVALFSIEKKSEKSHFAKVQSGSKLIRDEISLLTPGQFQKKVNTFIRPGMENPAKLIPSQY